MASQPPVAGGAPLAADSAPLAGGEALASVPAAAPVAEAPIAEPIIEAPGATDPAAEAALAAEAPAPEGAEGEAAPAEVPAAEEKPAEGAPEAAAKPEAAFPTYEDFTLPEGIKFEGDDLGALTNILGKHGLNQDAAQELVQFGAARVKREVEAVQKRMEQHQIDVFEDTRKNWRDSFDKQAGNRRNTILNDAKAAITQAIPNEKARSEFWNLIAFTGVGDHPAFINAMAAIGKRGREGAAPGLSINTNVPQSAAKRRYSSRTS